MSPDAEPDKSAPAFHVIAIKSSGTRVIVGSCNTREAAESWAGLLQKYGALCGQSAHVEEVGSPGKQRGTLHLPRRDKVIAR